MGADVAFVVTPNAENQMHRVRRFLILHLSIYKKRAASHTSIVSRVKEGGACGQYSILCHIRMN